MTQALNKHLGRSTTKNVTSKLTKTSGDFTMTYSNDQKSGGQQSMRSISETVTKMRKRYNRVQAASKRCWVDLLNLKEPFYWDSKCEFRVAESQTRHCSWTLLRAWPKPVTERTNKDEGKGSLSPPLCHPDPGER